jgi:hypothetical protein
MNPMAGRHVRPFGGNLGSSAAAMRTAARPTLVPRAPLLVSRRGGGARGPQSFRGALSRASRVAVGPRHSCRMEPAASSADAARERPAPEPSRSSLPEFTLWQWRPVPSGSNPSDNLYRELYVEWPLNGSGPCGAACAARSACRSAAYATSRFTWAGAARVARTDYFPTKSSRMVFC